MVQKSRHTEKKIALKIAARILVRFLYFEVEIAPRDYFFRAANFGVFLEKSRGAKKNRAEIGMSWTIFFQVNQVEHQKLD